MALVDPAKLVRERVITGTHDRLNGKVMRLECFAKAAICEDAHVLPRAPIGVLAPVNRQRITDLEARGGDVCEREGLPPERERRDVMPAGEILG